jgi:hypothetical protein
VAETWLSEANPALGNRVPTDLLLTDEGTRAVETVRFDPRLGDRYIGVRAGRRRTEPPASLRRRARGF